MGGLTNCGLPGSPGEGKRYAQVEGGMPVEDCALGGADDPIVLAGELDAAGERPGLDLAGVETVLEGIGVAGLPAWATRWVGDGRYPFGT